MYLGVEISLIFLFHSWVVAAVLRTASRLFHKGMFQKDDIYVPQSRTDEYLMRCGRIVAGGYFFIDSKKQCSSI